MHQVKRLESIVRPISKNYHHYNQDVIMIRHSWFDMNQNISESVARVKVKVINCIPIFLQLNIDYSEPSIAENWYQRKFWKGKTMDTALMETNHSKDFIVRLALQSKMEEGMVSKEESGETSSVAEVDGDEHSKMFLVKMAVPSLFFAASFVAFIWYSPAWLHPWNPFII